MVIPAQPIVKTKNHCLAEFVSSPLTPSLPPEGLGVHWAALANDS